MGIIEWIGIGMVLVTGYLLYSYITYREKEEKGPKAFFTVKKQKRALIYSIVIVVLTLVTFFYGFYRNGYAAVQCYLNICMLVLLAAMAWVDFKEQIIPNKLILVGLVMWVVESTD